MEVYNIDIQDLAKDFQKKFACSVSVSNIEGHLKKKEIVIQVIFGIFF